MINFWNEIREKFVTTTDAALINSVFDDDGVATDEQRNVPCWESELISISGSPFLLSYKGGRGVVSDRLVTCQRLDRNADLLYLRAFCHSRVAVRQFRVDRILTIVNPHTGEVFDEPVAFFTQFQIDRSQRSKPGWGLGVRQRADLVAILNALIFMARADRDYHALEREVLEDCIARYWLRTEAPGDPDVPAILAHADRLMPDAETFFVSLNRCAANHQLVRLVKESAAAVIDADGRHAAEELYWGTKIDEFFKASI